ncbi:4Fe-4S binding protein [Fusobacterium necrophorum]|uniref:4Fe-4S binding protein n=1 Tax=Fusobacterium necrophorum TaxID=859 RepID=UPI00255018F3|nr:4Fe-4S binding protein [Fusobacterium necrophorum]MDK4501598.1 4Fe-4S binding protein [Fusobacterium necrophorum]
MKRKAKCIENRCIMCRACVRYCPVKAVDRKINIDRDVCIGCGSCVKACQHGAMILEEVEDEISENSNQKLANFFRNDLTL